MPKSKSDPRITRYSRLWRGVVIVTSIVSLAPLIVLTAINYLQYRRALREEVEERTRHLTSLTKRSLEFFLEERLAALRLIAREKSDAELSDPARLAEVFRDLKDVLGGIVDLGFLDPAGKQTAYIGPYDLAGKDYSDQDWFGQVAVRGQYTSDVFTGYRGIPHFVMAVARNEGDEHPHVLRASVDSDILMRQLRSLETAPPSDVFIINQRGVLQTPSLRHGELLKDSGINPPPYTEHFEVREERDERGDLYMLGYAYIDDSPFILILKNYPSSTVQHWLTTRAGLWVFLLFSALAILLLAVGTSSYLVSRIREADDQRAQIAHNVEYTNKMASLGRLAAGVAHEINNPLAVVNEKAGMIKDIATLSGGFPEKDRIVALVDSIHNAVERGSRITRRLLGFAKHIDVNVEPIDLESFTKEVISFLEHEANYRKVAINVRAAPDLPTILSDRGQLQQVFLNILNNSLSALAEVERAGWVRICLNPSGADHVTILFTDNGPGIPEHLLKHIFEPFFTTRSEGAGLGLSITYGIVEKLGGDIEVQSTVGHGTSFVVTLPVRSPQTADIR